MVNPAQRPQKAGIVVLIQQEDTWHCLLLRAYRNWGFPKGEIEPGETPLAAAKREVREETSLDQLVFRWGDVYIETRSDPRHAIARYYLAVSLNEQVHLPVSEELGRPEHHEFRWVTFPQAKALLAAHLRCVVTWAEKMCQTLVH